MAATQAPANHDERYVINYVTKASKTQKFQVTDTQTGRVRGGFASQDQAEHFVVALRGEA